MHMLKAFVGAAMAGLGALSVAMQDEGPGGSTITAEEGWAAFGATLVALGLVWAVPNSGRTPQ